MPLRVSISQFLWWENLGDDSGELTGVRASWAHADGHPRLCSLFWRFFTAALVSVAGDSIIRAQSKGWI